MPRYLLHVVILCLIGLQCTQGHGGAKQGNRTRRHVGAKRDFASVGGATEFIQKISIDRPDQLERVMRRSGVEDIALPAFAQMLEEDPDLVCTQYLNTMNSNTIVVNLFVPCVQCVIIPCECPPAVVTLVLFLSYRFCCL